MDEHDVFGDNNLKRLEALESKDKSFYMEFQEKIKELEAKIEALEKYSRIHDDALINFEAVLRKVIYEHINTQGDEYGEDIQELLRMMDGFKKKLGTTEEKEPPFICPECNTILNIATTTTTGTDPNETYYHCSSCLRDYPESFLKKSLKIELELGGVRGAIEMNLAARVAALEEVVVQQRKQLLSEKDITKYFFNAGYEKGNFEAYWEQYIDSSIKINKQRKYSWEV